MVHVGFFSRHAREPEPRAVGGYGKSHAAVLTPQISPMLAVSDANGAIEFYQGRFQCERPLASGW